MTPHELNLHIAEYGRRTKQERDDKITLAYLTAAWHPMRTKKMPNLDELLGEKPKKKQQTTEQMLQKVKMLNAVFGGNVEVR